MNYIWLSRSEISEKEKQKINEVIDSGYLGMGKYVLEFENKLKKYFGVKNAVCVNTGTSAIHLALESLQLEPDDEVLVQSLTYVATYQAITAANLKPVSVEICPETCTINLEDAEKKITSKTKVIMPVHYASRTGDLNAIYFFAKKFNLRVIEDAAHAFGSNYKDKKVGSFGDIICFSFDPIKNITCGEGGAVLSNDDNVIQYIMDSRLLGVQKDSIQRYNTKRSWNYDVLHQGYRYHMNNIAAGIGLIQLSRFENEFKPYRQQLAKRYYDLLSNIDEIILFSDDYDEIVPHIFPIRIINNKRDIVKHFLTDYNIDSGIHYYPNHYLSYFKNSGLSLPITENIHKELLSIPFHCQLTVSEQDYIISKIKSALKY